VILWTITRTHTHLVRLLHASTGQPVGTWTARLDPPWPWWSVRVTPDGVVVSSRPDLPPPRSPRRLLATLTDPAAAAVLVLPDSPGLPERMIAVDLDHDVVEVRLHPVKMTLTVVLLTHEVGSPRTGADVVARATHGAAPVQTVPLHEGEPGTYTSPNVEWTAELTPADLVVDGVVVRRFAMDFGRARTRLRLTDSSN